MKKPLRTSIAVILPLIVGLVALWAGWWRHRWEFLSAGRAYSIQKVSDPAGTGETCLRFEVRKGDAWRNRGGESFRAEIETPEHPPMNSVCWYRFSLWLPQDFPVEDNRLVLAQWHGVDKKYLGEPSRSPVMALRYVNGKFRITMRHSAERIVHDPDAAPSEDLFETKALPLNEWNDFVVQARWSFTEDGLINVWWNGQPIVQYHGPVGYNDDEGPYFQFGIYRDDTDKTYVSYMKHVKMGHIPEEVDFKFHSAG